MAGPQASSDEATLSAVAQFLLLLVLVAFAVGWVAVSAVAGATDEAEGVQVLRALLRPEIDAVFEAPPPPGPDGRVRLGKDLLDVQLSAAEAQRSAGRALATQRRAQELYEGGIPPDPGAERTEVNVPRAVVRWFTAVRHDGFERAEKAAVAGLAASTLFGFALARGARRFTLPGAAALVAWVIVSLQLAVVEYWYTAHDDASELLAARFTGSAAPAQRMLLYGGIALVVAGGVFSVVLRAWSDDEEAETGAEAPAPAPITPVPQAFEASVPPPRQGSSRRRARETDGGGSERV